jgi:hypothetical protein
MSIYGGASWSPRQIKPAAALPLENGTGAEWMLSYNKITNVSNAVSHFDGTSIPIRSSKQWLDGAVPFMKTVAVVLIVASAVTFTLFARSGDKPKSSIRTPVLVELFTSEGCSDCPPADAFLQKLDQQPVSTKELIVLSEHVDYWNHDGWTDPYSSHAFSQRQDDYMQHFHLASVYTPQMVVDGSTQFVGNNVKEAEKALTLASSVLAAVQIGAVSLEGNTVRAHIDVGALPEHSKKSDIIFVVALNHAESQVARGENAGRHLAHVAVVRRLDKVGTIDAKAPFSRDVSVKLEKLAEKADLRVIAFVQEPGPGRVLGAAMQRLGE